MSDLADMIAAELQTHYARREDLFVRMILERGLCTAQLPGCTLIPEKRGTLCPQCGFKEFGVERPTPKPRARKPLPPPPDPDPDPAWEQEVARLLDEDLDD